MEMITIYTSLSRCNPSEQNSVKVTTCGMQGKYQPHVVGYTEDVEQVYCYRVV